MHATDQLDSNELTQSGSRASTTLAIRERPSAWRRLFGDSKAIAGGVILLVLIFASVGAPMLTSYAPEKQDIRHKLQAPAWQSGGDTSHLLGTDQLGRDLLTRILYGGRVSLFIALVATLGASLLGIALGVLSGYFGSFTDTIIMRLVDVQMAFPSILLALAVMVMLGSGIRNLIIVLAVTSWVFFSRVVRADVLTIRHRDYVEAGRAIGATHWRLIWYYIAPNLVGTITVVATLTVARTIISEASLSFLGLGIQPPTPSWGGMLADGRGYLSVAWWIGTFPGVALMATVIAVNLLGDALRDVLDPQIDASEN